MMKKKIDFTEVEGGFDTLPEGDYECFIFDMKERQSSAGNDMLEVILKVADGKHKGRQLWHYLVFTPAALFKVKEFVEAVGLDVDGKAVEVDFSEMIGHKVGVKIKHEMYKGAAKEKVDKVFNIEGGANSPSGNANVPF